MSSILFYGPGAEGAARKEAREVGRLLVPPVGAEGLKVDEARELVDLLLSTPVGTRVGVVVVGPLDDATPNASDVLLKPIEDLAEDVVRVVLWARDMDTVLPTLRSRCLARWVGGETDEVEIEEEARDLIEAVVSGREYEVPELVLLFKKRERELLRQMSRVLSVDPSPAYLRVWEAIRSVARERNPTWVELVAALLSVQPQR